MPDMRASYTKLGGTLQIRSGAKPEEIHAQAQRLLQEVAERDGRGRLIFRDDEGRRRWRPWLRMPRVGR